MKRILLLICCITSSFTTAATKSYQYADEVIVRQHMMYLILFFLLFAPFKSEAVPILTTKKDLLLKALDQKKLAYGQLHEAYFLVTHIVDLDKREYMAALITSAFTTATVPDARMKVLTVGLSLVGAVACDCYDSYQKFRNHMLQAGYHLDLCEFYNKLSLQYAGDERNQITDKGTRYFFFAIDCITMCEIKINFQVDYDTRRALSECIIRYKGELLNQIERQECRLSLEIYEKGVQFFQELLYLSGECDSEDFLEIHEHAYSMLTWLEEAMQAWGMEIPEHDSYD